MVKFICTNALTLKNFKSVCNFPADFNAKVTLSGTVEADLTALRDLQTALEQVHPELQAALRQGLAEGTVRLG